MISLMIYNLFFSTIFVNAVYSINLAEFNNLSNSISEKIIYNSLNKEEIINKRLNGINQGNLEKYLGDYIERNIRTIKIRAKFYYYNSDFTSCSLNECNSVQILLETQNTIPSLKKEFNFEVVENI